MKIQTRFDLPTYDQLQCRHVRLCCASFNCLLTQFSFAATLPHCAPAPWDFCPDPPVHFPSGVCPMHRCFHPPPFVPCPCLEHCIYPTRRCRDLHMLMVGIASHKQPCKIDALRGPAAACTVRGASGWHAGLKCPKCRGLRPCLANAEMVKVHSIDPYAVGRIQELSGKPRSQEVSRSAAACLSPGSEGGCQRLASLPLSPQAPQPPPPPPAAAPARLPAVVGFVGFLAGVCGWVNDSEACSAIFMVCRPASCWRRWPSKCSPSCGVGSWKCRCSASSSEHFVLGASCVVFIVFILHVLPAAACWREAK